MNSRDDDYEESFSFVDNEALQNNLGDALRCAVELTVIAKKYPAPIRSTLYKTSIVHIASIVEAILHYSAVKIIGETYEDSNWTYRNAKLLCKIQKKNDLNLEIVGVERFKKVCKLTGYIDFKVLNKLCLEEKFYNKSLFDKIEEMRGLRNKIHLFGLESVDRKYQKRSVESVSRILYKVLKVVKILPGVI